MTYNQKVQSDIDFWDIFLSSYNFEFMCYFHREIFEKFQSERTSVEKILELTLEEEKKHQEFIDGIGPRLKKLVGM